MAVFPRETHKGSLNAQEIFLSRWMLLVAASFFVFFGLLPGLVKDVEIRRGLQSADRNNDNPHFAKREPLRALASAERKDGTGAHAADADGALRPRSAEIAYPAKSGRTAPSLFTTPLAAAFWPGPLPRAPPAVS